jgi:uncharacterized damage-inducible protein DinB
MYQHNAWANQRVLDVVGGLQSTTISDGAKGTFGSIEQTVKHMIGVEDVYLIRILGKELTTHGSQDDYLAHDLTWFRQRSADLGRDYARLLASANEQLLERELVMPWIRVPLTVREGLIQVLSHSAQHRPDSLDVRRSRPAGPRD